MGGGSGNTASSGWATVSGGSHNQASGDTATVGGGFRNTASGESATVGGGRCNRAGDLRQASCTHTPAVGGWTTVGGGINNLAKAYASTVGGGVGNVTTGDLAFIGGGLANTASGARSVVSGGWGNSAEGFAAAVAGGASNTAAGDYSFAAGLRAKANANGCFVWGDSIGSDVRCDTTNRTIFRSSGGFYIYTNAGLTTGAFLASGSGSWSSISDRNAKENFEPVDPQAVLEKVAQLPITTWNYKTQDDAIRHMGPTAQDFYAAFGLGDSDKTIATVDADGVALAAIQGLYERNQALEAEVRTLQAENAALREQLEAQQQRMDNLEARLAALEQGRTPTRRLSEVLPGLGLFALLAGLVLVGRRQEVGR